MSINLERFSAYHDATDEQLCRLTREGDRFAEEILVSRYTRLVRQLARPCYLAGGDSDDLMQEGMIGLIHGVREYDAQRAASFRTFAEICIRSRLNSAIRAAARDKHTPLNQSVPLEIPFFDSHTTSFGTTGPSLADPEELFISREATRDIMDCVHKQLSAFEAKILGYYLDGLTTREMAEAVHKPPKSVDNAVQRIRRKFAGCLTSGELSTD